MVNLSAVVLTKNEEKNLANCLAALQFCDEIVVVDGFSTDKTVEIAKKFGAQVYTRDLNGDFSAQRNFAQSKAQGKWLLFIDADELVPLKLQKAIIKQITRQGNFTSGYLFRRTDVMWGHEIKHGEIGDVRLLRLAQKGAGKWHRRVHEHWHIIGEVKEFGTPLMHYPHPTISDFVAEINDRTTLHALANREEGKKSSVFTILTYPVGKFMYGYFVRGGFLDAIAGFVIATVMSLHSFISWSKLWFLQKS